MKISLSRQIAEVERELRQRRSVYPRLVSSGRLRQAEADYNTESMEGVLRTLTVIADNEDAFREDLRKALRATRGETAAEGGL